ncbi:MAG: TIGR04255 family protein [Gemmatimonadota bacterium]|nr:TIGR04255 family protein [Gemmatimonadota bacterium]
MATLTTPALPYDAMSEHPHLARAPIREALIDLRVRLAPEFSQDTLRTLADELAAHYPNVGPISQYQGQIQIGDEGPVTVQKGPLLLGYRLESEDGRHVAQIRVDGFTFSRLAPYESWDRMIDHAWVVWERYTDATNPMGIERIATRFINRIPLAASGQLGEVFSMPPRVPDGTIDALLFRYQLAPREGVTGIVTLATEDSAEPSMVLDIDCFVRRSLPSDEETLRRHLPQLRDAKNRIFFGSLTPAALEGFK